MKAIPFSGLLFKILKGSISYLKIWIEASRYVTPNQRLDRIRLQLLREKKWRFLRYVHLREAFLAASPRPRSLLAVGAGVALAELAMALEFPNLSIRVTDIKSKTTPNYGRATIWATRWKLKNISFGIFDLHEPTSETADFVEAIEVLEHIKNDRPAARVLQSASSGWVFCLVPFANHRDNADPLMRARVMRRHGHYRVGYDENDLRSLFSSPVIIRGCYWKEHGQELRSRLTSMDSSQVSLEMVKEAFLDIRDQIPVSIDDAQGIWILSRVK